MSYYIHKNIDGKVYWLTDSGSWSMNAMTAKIFYSLENAELWQNLYGGNISKTR